MASVNRAKRKHSGIRRSNRPHKRRKGLNQKKHVSETAPADRTSDIIILPRKTYTVGLICALPVEMAACRGMLDEFHGRPRIPTGDGNSYCVGSISGHNVVIACLPAEGTGTNSAATVATNMGRTFPSLCVWLLVGIGGGVPGDVDLRLGDVVVGTRIYQYDYGKIEQGMEFRRTSALRMPSHAIMTAVSALQAKHKMSTRDMSGFLHQFLRRSQQRNAEYMDPGANLDLLFESTYRHNINSKVGCESCDTSRIVKRTMRRNREPAIYYTTIASANSLMKDALARDQLMKVIGNACFEMEAAGFMSSHPCLVIRGISDYSDSHKNKRWQGYASATAAAYVKDLLSVISLKAVSKNKVRRTGTTARDSGKAVYHPVQEFTDVVAKKGSVQIITPAGKFGIKAKRVTADINSVQYLGKPNGALVNLGRRITPLAVHRERKNDSAGASDVQANESRQIVEVGVSSAAGHVARR